MPQIPLQHFQYLQSNPEFSLKIDSVNTDLVSGELLPE